METTTEQAGGASMADKPKRRDDRKLVKVKGHPGIYKRGDHYIATYYLNGKQRKEIARTIKEAVNIRAARRTDIDRGELREESKRPFKEYAAEWLDGYHGRGGRGFRESTRDDYRRDLEYAYKFFGDRKPISHITPGDIARFVTWLNDPAMQGKQLSPASLRRIVAPVRSCLRTAVEHESIRRNPAQQVSFPAANPVKGDGLDAEIEGEFDERVKVLTIEQLEAFLSIVHARYRLLFEFLASTGLRVSELRALQWRHMHLDGSTPHVKIRRQIYKGRLGQPKSKSGRRDLPLDPELVAKLRGWRKESKFNADDDLVFPTRNGTPFADQNLSRRYLKPAAEEVGAPWASPHTFRHTHASILFARGFNVKQVQERLGHSDPMVTMRTYIHLLDDGVGEAVALSDVFADNVRGKGGAISGTKTEENESALALP